MTILEALFWLLHGD